MGFEIQKKLQNWKFQTSNFAQFYLKFSNFFLNFDERSFNSLLNQDNSGIRWIFIEVFNFFINFHRRTFNFLLSQGSIFTLNFKSLNHWFDGDACGSEYSSSLRILKYRQGPAWKRIQFKMYTNENWFKFPLKSRFPTFFISPEQKNSP